MKALKYIELSSDLVKKIVTTFPSKIFKSQSHLFYEGQIPISGFLIVDGSIKISNKKRFHKILKTGTLLGVGELMNREPINISAEAFPNTVVCFIDRTTLLEMHERGLDDVYNILKPYFERVSQ